MLEILCHPGAMIWLVRVGGGMVTVMLAGLAGDAAGGADAAVAGVAIGLNPESF